MKTLCVQLLILVLFILPAHLFAEGNDPETKSSIFDMLQGEEVLEMTITTDLRELLENRRLDEYLPASISWHSKVYGKEHFDIKVKPRGKYRRKICPFPPLKLNFDKDDLKSRNLSKHDKLKLVTHCIEDKAESKLNVIKEYLAYKMYNELTANSFRVQLVNITYVDINGAVAKRKRYGFIIEDNDQLADRLDGEVCDCLNPETDKVVKADERLVGFFQYMIGNEDWDMTMGRNLELITKKENGSIVPVPYDFDFSGFVNPSYALPNKDYQLATVTDRYYLGMALDNSEIKQTFIYFQAKRPNLEAVLLNFSMFNQRQRKRMLSYLNSFYENMEAITATKEENWFVLMKKAGRSTGRELPAFEISTSGPLSK